MKCRIKNYKHCTISFLAIFLFITAVSGSFTSLICLADEPPENEWVVVIDAGHGGKDPGAKGRTSKEKDITLAIALKTGKYIEELLNGVKVIYTRKGDEFVELYKRAEIANKAKADLFISIHCNGFRDSRIKGSETFVMGIHKDQGNLEVAMKENSVITLEEDYTTRYQGYDPNSSESFIIFSLMQNIYLEQSLNFANYIQDQFRVRVGLDDRGVKQAGLIVLWQTTMPSVLVEAGFITNSQEERFLKSGRGQDYIASAIFRAFRDYKAAIDQKSDFSTSAREEKIQDDKIWFMIQLATSTVRREELPEQFTRTGEITELESGKYFKYATGKYVTYNEAALRRKELQEEFPDAFVIAVRNHKIIPLQEAIELTGSK
ncbi:MAG TPA: N-acetylmuramoyl-L-alanine amidase [Bacteroidetes bacterium]|nr:N-acetylmuramoyl-L-alanine amidase [Bacteroidota bacterium]